MGSASERSQKVEGWIRDKSIVFQIEVLLGLQELPLREVDYVNTIVKPCLYLRNTIADDAIALHFSLSLFFGCYGIPSGLEGTVWYHPPKVSKSDHFALHFGVLRSSCFCEMMLVPVWIREAQPNILRVRGDNVSPLAAKSGNRHRAQ